MVIITDKGKKNVTCKQTLTLEEPHNNPVRNYNSHIPSLLILLAS